MDTQIQPVALLVWTVGGTDVQADLHAFDAFEVRGCAVAEVVDAQDLLDEQQLQARLDALARDGQPAAIKISLPRTVANLRALVRCIDQLRAADPPLALVVDPVLHGSGASRDLIDACVNELLPRATLVIPSRAEAAALLGISAIDDDAGMEDAAYRLREITGCRAIVITGDRDGEAHEHDADHAFMLTEQATGWLSLPRTAATQQHRAGRFAASAAAAFARGFVAADAVVLATMATAQARRAGGPATPATKSALPDHSFALDPANLPGLLPASMPAGSIRFAGLTDPQMNLYAVVDSAAWVQRVLAAGVRTVQLRIKDPAHPALREEIRQSIAAARSDNAQLFINDHWQIALEEGAYGVHLGQEDLATADLPRLAAAGLRLGISTHAYWEVCRAVALQPSYIACGPIHPTAAKAMPWIPQGNDNLGYWCALLKEPVVAIAGMDFDRAAEAVRRGADGVAVISGITAAESPERAIADFMQSIRSGRRLPQRSPPRLPRPTLARTA